MMFKNSFGAGAAEIEPAVASFTLSAPPRPALAGRTGPEPAARFGPVLICAALVLAVAVAGCASAPAFPTINLEQAGWTVRRGQAVWKKARGAPDVAGDLIVASRGDDRAFVQFSKDPFPLIVAQSSRNGWEVKIPMQNEHHAGHGKPPLRLIWLYLPRVLAGEPPPKGWTWHKDSQGWALRNPRTGESLEGYFSE